MEAFYEWFRWLYEATGINLTIVYDEFDRKRMISGFWTTVWLCLVCIALSIVIGVVGAWLQGSRLKWTRRGVQGFIALFRDTPPLVQIYFFYFGLGALLPRIENAYGIPEPVLTSMQWAIISLSLFAGAFNVEIFRSGIEAVPKATVEAAEALGYSRLGAYVHVVLPLAVRICLPALNNNIVNLVKTTTLAYAIAVPEMLYVSKQIWSDATNVPEMMTFLLLAYFFLVGCVVWAMARVERALKVPGIGL
ncbi:amino acid ABC transporter membrane protein 1 (PAAT family) [Stella humosa]|uniref:Amino acid ABC transporter membrane protein 1 (PAAT family) n=1 Tax=Stella humosa TaxID=94 RepID=A0A3N1MF13_9PROT|nr:amino acid ABC transporter permease [Stella humosa]ROQ01287.1 amino acid ABC transporter membrane protein 1 (PAAT family) [Stella humosa]BBK31661.1 amino acid ABC transporter [Stella humosa]